MVNNYGIIFNSVSILDWDIKNMILAHPVALLRIHMYFSTKLYYSDMKITPFFGQITCGQFGELSCLFGLCQALPEFVVIGSCVGYGSYDGCNGSNSCGNIWCISVGFLFIVMVVVVEML